MVGWLVGRHSTIRWPTTIFICFDFVFFCCCLKTSFINRIKMMIIICWWWSSIIDHRRFITIRYNNKNVLLSSFICYCLFCLMIMDYGIQAYPMPQMRICIQSIDTNRLPSQCIYCKSRTFPLTVRMCTGNPYLPARMTLIEASCLVATCRKQLPRFPPEPYSVVRPMFANSFGVGGGGGLGASFNNIHHDAASNSGNNHHNGNGNNDDLGDDSNGGMSNGFEDGPESMMASEQSNTGNPANNNNKVRKPAKFFLGKPQKIQTSRNHNNKNFLPNTNTTQKASIRPFIATTNSGFGKNKDQNTVAGQLEIETNMTNIGGENAHGHHHHHNNHNHHQSSSSLNNVQQQNGTNSTSSSSSSSSISNDGLLMVVPNYSVGQQTSSDPTPPPPSTTAANTGPKKLRLLSPVGAEPAEYDWPLVVSNKFNPAQEIIETIKLVAEEFSDLKIALEKNVLTNYNTTSYEKMKNFCDKYNKVIKESLQMWKGTSIQTEKRPTTELLSHIMQMCYNSSVGDPQKLNKFYEPFSPEVYGETSFKFVQQMIDEIGINEDDVFIDLGSGIGQVVLHVAAAVNCVKCIGIEKADLPGNYADKMQVKFRFWMNWFGRTYSDFELYRGDFFNEEYKDMIYHANFIFVNNFAFGPEVDHRLKDYFENLKDGAKILSSKAFCSLNFRFSQRNLSDIGAMMKVEEITPLDTQSVSWTNKPVSYFLHTIDRKRLCEYFEKSLNHRLIKKKKRINDDHTDGGSNNDDSSSDLKDENSIPNKWTRKAWSEYISSHPSSSSTNNNQTVTSNHHHHNHNHHKSTSIANGFSDKAHNISSTAKSDTKPVQQQQQHYHHHHHYHNNDSNKNNSKRSRGRPRKNNNKMDADLKDETSHDETESKNPSIESSLSKGNDLNDENDENAFNRTTVAGAGSTDGSRGGGRTAGVFDSANTNSAGGAAASAPTNRRGRPKKNSNKKKMFFTNKKKIKGINLNSLNVLHEKTVLSTTAVSSSYSAPPPGCVEQRLCSKLDENTVSVPNITVINKDIIQEEIVTPPMLSPYSTESNQGKNNNNNNNININSNQSQQQTNNDSVTEFNGMKIFKPVNLNELLFLFGHQINAFDNLLKSKDFIENLKQTIVQHETTNDNINYQINLLNKQIYEDKYNLKRYLKDLNIESTADLLTKIKDCEDDITNLKAHIDDIKQVIVSREEELKDLYSQLKQNEEKRREESKRKQLLIAELTSKQLQLQQQQQQNQTSIETQKNFNNEPVIQTNSEQQNEKQDPIESSPKINYKEMKYKKYLSNEAKSSKRNNNVESPQVSAPSTPTPPLSSNSNEAIGPDGVKSSDAIKIDVNRINSVIMKGFNEENKNGSDATATNQITTSSNTSKSGQKRSSSQMSMNNGVNNQQTITTTKRTRNRKETKIETLKQTKKGDRDVIIERVGGHLTFERVHRKSSDASSNTNDSTTTKNGTASSTTPKHSSTDPTEKPIKLKINCKESKVKILNDSENVTETTDSSGNNRNNKRKLSSTTNEQTSTNSNNNVTSSSISKRTRASEKQEKEKNNINSEKNIKDAVAKSDSPAESKRPVVLKLGFNGGQYYSQTSIVDDDDDEEEDDDDDLNKSNNSSNSSSSNNNDKSVTPSANNITNDHQSSVNETALESNHIKQQQQPAAQPPMNTINNIDNKTLNNKNSPSTQSATSVIPPINRSTTNESSNAPNNESSPSSRSGKSGRKSSSRSNSNKKSSSSNVLTPNTNLNLPPQAPAAPNAHHQNETGLLYAPPQQQTTTTANMYSQQQTTMGPNQPTSSFHTHPTSHLPSSHPHPPSHHHTQNSSQHQDHHQQPNNNDFAMNYRMNLFNMATGNDESAKNYFNTNGYLAAAAANGIAGHHHNFGANDLYNSLKNTPSLLQNMKDSFKTMYHGRGMNYGQMNHQTTTANPVGMAQNSCSKQDPTERFMHQYEQAAAAFINQQQQNGAIGGGGGYDGYGAPPGPTPLSCRYQNPNNPNNNNASINNVANDFMANAATAAAAAAWSHQ